MNLSMRWLREFVPLEEMPVRQFTEAMTMSGSKVESWEREGSEISNVVVGKVLSLERHPNSDHLWITKTDVGSGEPLQIITGAQNLKTGDLVPVALHGSTLPGGKKIKRGRLRGLESNGMLCSLGELGLTKHDFPYAVEDGIFVLQEDCRPGQPICEALGYDDTRIEFEITSNRPDCFSVIGLAREAAATFGRPLRLHTPAVKGGAGPCVALLDARVEAPDLCPMYAARAVRNVRVGPSPRWMRERLRAMGVRPINNIVDITNYVMLEYGQPMHAFDYRCLAGHKIRVRRAAAGEAITTLDGTRHGLTPGNLVIADAEKPVAVAGVMGGGNSEISDRTADVVFESACFNGPSVRRTARGLGLRTDASALYEKGLDPNNCVPALDRACELVELLDAGDVTDGDVRVKNFEERRRRIPLERDWINRFLDISLSADEMKAILAKLGCGFDGDDVLVPTFRPDLEHKADIAEEIARFYGYDKIPCAPLRGGAQGGYSARQKLRHTVDELMRALGASEIMTYSFLGPRDYDKIRMPQDCPLRRSVTIANPLGEDTSRMRTVALPSMMDTLARNYHNRNESACLYELAKIYLPTAPDRLPDEREILICGMYGEGADFFRAKGMVEELLDRLGITDWEIEAAADEYSYHPGRCARLSVGGEALGVLGELHPEVTTNYGMEGRAVSFSLDFEVLAAHARMEKTYAPLPKFPAVARDLALVCDDGVPVGRLEKAIRAGAGGLLEKVRLFDVYRGEQIAGGKKSVAFSIVLRSGEGTLTDGRVSAVMKKIVAELEKAGAALRL
ncbi:MAG TPA: phenylalanine--tRNA ligase subunit beta [Ruminococcaceae bacterium]|jgi:phenylalanyl-tRNA synthetase beta chain|nr:phenylalanine--tRNA ligase subunit beta [Oscillospiraceae bacterium]HBQ45633.1 phenylalanine--tRNA ligase subunit beta [Oscillospiraceae bacterium]HBT90566.1 phenylalanine--tRNA ligase subunit beta [Oscillospiraceae bacterium]HCB91678.1 phenylalanine--tRNA ligase subunit beta [Oscillospiraceae bacterium]